MSSSTRRFVWWRQLRVVSDPARSLGLVNQTLANWVKAHRVGSCAVQTGVLN